jgi:D-alanyl-D-alanine carboxypeptidase (penicillin-binding protein 5/6)
LPRKSRAKMTVKVKYEGPLPTPIVEGDQVASLIVSAPGAQTIEVPLFAGQSVERLGPVGRMFSGIKHLVMGGF